MLPDSWCLGPESNRHGLLRSCGFSYPPRFSPLAGMRRSIWSLECALAMASRAVGPRRPLSTPSRKIHALGSVLPRLFTRGFADFDGIHLGRFRSVCSNCFKSAASTCFATEALQFKSRNSTHAGGGYRNRTDINGFATLPGHLASPRAALGHKDSLSANTRKMRPWDGCREGMRALKHWRRDPETQYVFRREPRQA